MVLVGLTGGIAAGKSTVAAKLAEHGAVIIDADQVAREVVEPGTVGFQRVIQEFGEKLIDSNGSLNRKALADIVFADPNKRVKLERILHPLIRSRTSQLFEQNTDSVVIYAVPLLVEAEVDYPFDLIVTVEAGEEEQLRRLITQRGLTEKQAKERIEAQTTRTMREGKADFVIDSSGPIEALEPQIHSLWKLIESKRSSGQ